MIKLLQLSDCFIPQIQKWLSSEKAKNAFCKPKDLLIKMNNRYGQYAYIYNFIICASSNKNDDKSNLVPIGFCQISCFRDIFHIVNFVMPFEGSYIFKYFVAEEIYDDIDINKQIIDEITNIIFGISDAKYVAIPDVRIPQVSKDAIIASSFAYDENEKLYIKKRDESGNKENIIISACLLGISCRYDASLVKNAEVLDCYASLNKNYNLIAVCPEIAGGLPVPREACERYKNRILSKTGRDLSREFEIGAVYTCELAQNFCCQKAILKERSPSCGFGFIHDGSFTSGMIPGNGVFAELLFKNNFSIFGETTVKQLI